MSTAVCNLDHVRRAFAPRRKTTVTEWAESNLTLSERSTAFPGPFRIDRTPYLREPVDALLDRNMEELTICSAAQIAKTTAIITMLAYAIDQDPGPSMLVLPNDTLCKSFSEQRLHPVIDDCPTLSRHKPENVRKYRLQEIHFDRMQFASVGSNSPANLASRPVRYLFMDEIDKYPGANDREAGAVDLATKRTRTFWNRKIIKTSTPTTTNGEVWRSFLNGDQRFYHVPCPHCSTIQPIVFGRNSKLLDKYNWPVVMTVAWDDDAKTDGLWDMDRVRASAHLVCGDCKGKVHDRNKPWMLARGKWIAEAPKNGPKHRSYHLSALYPLWCKTGDAAARFLEAKDYPDKMQDFVNSDLGEPWEPFTETADETVIFRHRLGYKQGQCPSPPLAVIITADVQKNSVYYVVRAWGTHDRSWLLRYGILPDIYGLPSLASHPYRMPDGKTVTATHGFVDSGYDTENVYQFCNEHHWMPVKGFDDTNRRQPVVWADIDGRKLLEVASSHWKDALQTRLRIANEGPSSWHLPADCGRDYADMLTAEAVLEENNKQGRPVRKWVRLRRDNHYLDCEAYQLAAAVALNVRDWSPSGEDMVEGTKRPDGREWLDVA